MKSIVAKVSIILSIIYIVISICGKSSVDCLKGMMPIQKAIIDDGNILYGLQRADISFLPYKLIPFLCYTYSHCIIKYNKIY